MAELLIAVIGAAIGIAAVSVELIRRGGIESPAIAGTALATLVLLAALSAATHLHPPTGDPWLLFRAGAFVAASVSLTALAVSIGTAAARSSARSRRVERLAEELVGISEAGAVESTFANLLADDSVEIRFPSGDRLIDSAGRLAEFGAAPHRTRVEIRRGGAPVAYLEADADRADLRAITDGFGSAARIAMDNERWGADPRAPRGASGVPGAHRGGRRSSAAANGAGSARRRPVRAGRAAVRAHRKGTVDRL